MNTIVERITEAIKGYPDRAYSSQGWIDMFVRRSISRVGTIAGQVGQTPQGWNAECFFSDSELIRIR